MVGKTEKVKIELAGKVKYDGEHRTTGSELEIGADELSWFKRNDLVARVLTEYEEKKKDESNDGGDGSDEEGEKGNTEEESGIDIDSLEEKSSAELYEVAQELEIEGRSKLKNDKEAMVEAIKQELDEEAGE